MFFCKSGFCTCAVAPGRQVTPAQAAKELAIGKGVTEVKELQR